MLNSFVVDYATLVAPLALRNGLRRKKEILRIFGTTSQALLAFVCISLSAQVLPGHLVST
jgi:hypothetical protein